MSSHSTATIGAPRLSTRPPCSLSPTYRALSAWRYTRRRYEAKRVQEWTIRKRTAESMLRPADFAAIDTACRRGRPERAVSPGPRRPRRGRWSARLATARDELGDLLAALLPDLLEVLVPVLLRDGVAADLPDPSVEARAVQLLHLLTALLADLLVEVGAVALRGRAAALLADLFVELRPMSLRRRRATLPSRLGHGHRALVLRHPLTPLDAGPDARSGTGSRHLPTRPLRVQVPYRRSVGRSAAWQSADDHRTIWTRTAQRSGQPSAARVAALRSSDRPPTNGPRSMTGTTTCTAPRAIATSVPHASVRWATPSSSGP